MGLAQIKWPVANISEVLWCLHDDGEDSLVLDMEKVQLRCRHTELAH